MPRRRDILAGAVALGVSPLLHGPARAGDAWSAFLAAHERSGRVIDDFSGLSHSEGQGFAMRLAVHHGDRAAFERLWSWTGRELARDDGLFAWSWRDGQIADRNNASDGDITIAWALLEAAQRWRREEWRTAGLRTAQAVRELLTVERDGRLLLLPGGEGFREKDGLVVNPSYWVFPALDAFAAIEGSPAWRRLADAGTALLAETSGAYGLAPDWLELPANLAWKQRPRASYDAIRVPLWLLWSGRAGPQPERWLAFLENVGRAWIDSRSGALADYGLGIEQRSVLLLLRRWRGDGDVTLAGLPLVGTETSYYGAIIRLLVAAAWLERFGY
ncbi:glycosyl hydrolase family 8 [Geminicoccaceae bacterium 1502E]|nr:glycosyl hydrolase family 8 [Geminicoccaceae bacterium 1502E]